MELFNDESGYDEITAVAELPGIEKRIADILAENDVIEIEDFIEAEEKGQLDNIEGLTAEDIASVKSLIDSNVEFVDEEPEVQAETSEEESSEVPAEEASEEEVYECPECGARITIDMTTCPNCGIGLSFEYEDEE